jgi:Tol biopolymer transport system component
VNRIRGWIAVTVFVTLAFGAFAQGSARQPVILLPEFVSPDPADADVARQIVRAIGDDLRNSGSLALIEPGGDTTKAAAVVEGQVTGRSGSRIETRVRLWDPATNSMLLGHQYSVDRAQWRLVARAISDSILERLIGTPLRFPENDRR